MSAEPLLPPEALVEHARFLRAVARRLVDDPHAAQELEQETWLTALQQGPRDPRSVRAWLARVLRRRAERGARTEERRSRRERAAAREEALPSPLETLARDELLRRVTDAVLALEEPLRATLIARYYEDLEPIEFARRTGVPAGTVRTRLRRALELVRARLDREPGGREAWMPALLVFARGGRTPAGAAPLATVLGGIAMTSLQKLAAGTALAALFASLAFVVVQAIQRDEPGDEASAESAGLAVSPGAPSEDVANTARAPLEASGSLARSAVATDDQGHALALFRIRESDGSPAADVTAVLLDAAGEREVERTDREGVTRFAPRHGAAELVVERRDAPPWRGAVDASAGTRELALPEGAHVAGVVLVDGAPPREPLELRLLDAANAQDLPRLPDDPIERLLAPRSELHLRTSPDGRFAARGLPADWSGVLRLPEGHALRGRRATSSAWGHEFVEIAGPRTDLVIELERFPSLRGRILRNDGRAASQGRVEAHLTYSNGTGPIDGAIADADGRFELFARELPASVALEAFELPGSSGRREFEFAREALQPDGELGDLVLAPFRPPITLRVVDPEGTPVEHARAAESGWTDAEGRALVRGLAPEQRELVLVARGYLNRTVDLPDPAPEQLEVVLEPTTLLRIELTGEDGRPLEDQRFELRAAACPFVDGKHLPYVITWNEHEGRLVSAWVEREGGYRAKAHVGPQGAMELWALRTDLRLTVFVPAPVGPPLVEQQIEPLSEGEHRTVTFVVPERESLRGRVLDERGAPLAGARVRIVQSGGEPSSGASAPAGEDGSFELRRIAAGEYTLEATAPGFLPARVERARPDSDLIELRLARGLELRVRVEDELGQPVPGGRLALRLGGLGGGSYPVADGLFEFEGLAPEPLDLELHVGGGVYVRRWAPEERDVRFVLPVQGAVECTWGEWPDAWPFWIDLVLTPSQDGREPLELSLAKPPPGGETLPVVLPGEWTLAVRDGSSEAPRALAPPQLVRVEAGATTRVSITPE